MTGYQPPPRSWFRKIAEAFGGITAGMRGEASFRVHWLAALAVAVLAFTLGVKKPEALVLVVCVGVVFAAELFNSALERLAKAITSEHDENIRVALNIASGAVLMVCLLAAMVGLAIFVPHVVSLFART